MQQATIRGFKANPHFYNDSRWKYFIFFRVDTTSQIASPIGSRSGFRWVNPLCPLRTQSGWNLNGLTRTHANPIDPLWPMRNLCGILMGLLSGLGPFPKTVIPKCQCKMFLPVVDQLQYTYCKLVQQQTAKSVCTYHYRQWSREVELLRVDILLPGYPLTNTRRVPGYPFIGCSMFSALNQD